MTNKEAVVRINNLIKLIKSPRAIVPYCPEEMEALDLAIKALEFTESQRICCDNCSNRNIKSKEVCTSPFGECKFFNGAPDRSHEIAQKSIELGRSLGRTEERVESKRPQGETNAELFKQTFGIYATELWSMKEADFLKWLNTEVEERSQGQWDEICEPFGWDDILSARCSACGESYPYPEDTGFNDIVEMFKYCPNCGAKMEAGDRWKEEEDEE